MSSLRAPVCVTGVIIGRMAPRAATKTDSKLAVRLAALASLGGATIHFAVIPTHWREWMPAGVFFLSIALFQLVWARLALTRTTALVLAGGIAINVGALVLWAVSRTAGAPFGPHAGEAELVQAADLCALLLQIYVVMGAGWALYRGRRGQPIPAFGNAVVLLGAIVIVSFASTLGVASGLRHGHHAPGGAETGHHEVSSGHSGGHHDHHSDPSQLPARGTVHPLDAPAVVQSPPPAVVTPAIPPVEGSLHPLDAPVPVEPLPPEVDQSHEDGHDHHHD